MPDWKDEIAKRLAGTRLTPEREAEVIEEFTGHLNDDYERLRAAGASPGEARELALEGLNDRPPISDALRKLARPAPQEAIAPGATGGGASGFGRDVRYAFRTLKRSPGFTALAVLSLAIGIGGNVAMFRIVEAALIRPLPYAAPGRLVQAASSGYFPPGGLAYLQQASRTMDVAGYDPGVELNLTGVGEPLRLKGSAVSGNLFRVLGVGVQTGRAFQPGEEMAGRDNLIILSHELWKDQFASDPGVIGRAIRLGSASREVVGVAPRGFAFPDRTTQFWIPLHFDPRDPDAYWERGFMPVIGRLRAGASLSQAQKEIAALSARMLALFPYPMGRDWAATMTVVPLQQYQTAGIRLRLLVLQCAVGLVLLIACANVAGLLLARAASRQKEIALRLALGASRPRIVRQLLTESAVLALAGGWLGTGLAYSAGAALQKTLAGGSNPADSGANWELAAFATGLSLLTGVIFGLAPALIASRDDLARVIKSGGQRAAGAARVRLRSALIAGEVALAVVLTISAGLLIRSLWKLAQVNPGFRPQHVLTLRISPNQSLCRERSACIALYDELLRRAREIPGVEDAAAANTLPLASGIPASAVKIEGFPYAPAERAAPMFWAGAVTPGYFRLMGIRILQGRSLTASDGENAAPVIVVSAATARRYWPRENPIGKHIQLVWENRWRTVIGVAADVHQFDLADRSPDYIHGAMYMPYAQAEDTDRQLPAVMTLILRTGGEPTGVAGSIRDLMQQLNPNVPVDEIRSLTTLVNESTEQPRSMMWLFIGFAGVALTLAAIGAYGVVSYSMAQRTFEIGVRVAMGAGRRNIFGLVLGQSLRLVLAGLLLGLLASVALTRLLASFLYGTATTDPLTVLLVCGILVMVALIAGFVPARRAAAVDPITALRAD